jgi:preprotein translocase subunit YajC
MAVLLAIFEFLLWLQPAATPAASGGGSGGGPGAMGCGMNAAMMLGILAITYFFLLRPDAQRRKETEDMQKGLRVGMKVRTTGGILGEVVRVSDRDVVIAIAEKVRINVLRENIKGPEVDVAAPAGEAKKDAAPAAAASDDKK